jgi:signal transduction histidine kinase
MSLTGSFALDWALIAVSVFNTMLQLWLGLTVLLNAERRSWGVWLMGGGLLAGAAFFICHTAILGQELFFFANLDSLNFWWQIGWIPVIIAPLAWYIVILWYVGFWHEPQTLIRRRHRWWLLVVADMAFGLVFLMIFAHPIPSYAQIIQLDFSTSFVVNGIPILFALYPIFMVLCILLSLDALRRPEPADRLMGDLARQRSRPWLLATAGVLLTVSLLVAYFIFRVFSMSRSVYFPIELSIQRIALFDLALESLVALATVMLGQAIVSYEVFTGKVLPRRGFRRQWHIAVGLAAVYGAIIGLSLEIQLRPIYSLMLTALLMIAFYALYSWRSFAEREGFMARLRPFVSSQGLMHQFLGDDASTSSAYALFRAMCRDVLDTSQAHLIPAGGLANLAGLPLVYPASATPIDFSPDNLINDVTVQALDADDYHGLRWAIPLWAERGRIGTLLLGSKTSGSLYTQEEIEIARATGERIIDMLAGEQLARRLMVLQRGRLAESRVMDRRTRRALHDETLPTVHTALLRLSSLPRDNPAVNDAIQALTAVHQQIAHLIHSAHGFQPSPNGNQSLEEALRGIVGAEFGDEFNSISWQIEGEMPQLEPLAQEVILGAVREAARNAAVHGRGNKSDRPLNLMICIQAQADLIIDVIDDGVGLTADDKRHSTLLGGSGGGLTLHSTMLAILGGELALTPIAEGGTQVTIRYPNPQEVSRNDVGTLN